MQQLQLHFGLVQGFPIAGGSKCWASALLAAARQSAAFIRAFAGALRPSTAHPLQVPQPHQSQTQAPSWVLLINKAAL